MPTNLAGTNPDAFFIVTREGGDLNMDAQSYGGKGQTMEINARGVSAIVADTAANMRRSFTGERVPLNDIRRVIDTATD